MFRGNVPTRDFEKYVGTQTAEALGRGAMKSTAFSKEAVLEGKPTLAHAQGADEV